jgi:TM2 domain-containing membrane protein YozV
MNCANHADVPAVAYCRTCGKPLCSTCVRDVRGVVYCEECLASHLSAAVPPPGPATVPPGAEPASGSASPVWAAILGFIPGVGAMYNGEFAKGFLHVLIFATLIWLSDRFQGGMDVIFGFAIAAFVFYMPIEAYRTARARQHGLPPPDPLGLNNVFGGRNVWHGMFVSGSPQAPVVGAAPAPQMPEEESSRSCSRMPIGALILIGIGVLFLLDEFNFLHFDWLLQRFWPLILIAVGVRLLIVRRRRNW